MSNSSGSSPLPKGWKVESLAQLAKVQTGLAKGKKLGGDTVSLPYLRVANVQDGYFNLDEIKNIEIESDQVARYSLKVDDILLTEGGDFDKLGRGSIWKGQIEPCLHQNHVFAVRVNRDKLLPYFFVQQTGSHYGKQYFLSCAKQTTNLASINSSQLKEFPVILPSLEEQHKIAEILSAWDEAIEQETLLLELKRERKRGLMQQLLTGKVRFKEFEGLEWENVYLKDVLSESREYAEDELGKRLTVALHLKGVSVRQERDASETGKTVYYKRKAGQFIYGKQNLHKGALGIIPKGLDGYLSSQDIPAFDVRDGFSTLFVFYLFSQQHFYENLELISTGTGSKRIQPKELFRLQLTFPSLPEQQKIAAVLSAADAELETLTVQLAALRSQKRGLMQRLLTGKTRVRTDDLPG